MITGILIARSLGPELRGQYGLVIYAVGLISLGHFGLAPAITYYTGKRELDKSKILTFVLVSAFALGITFSAIFYFVYPRIPGIWTGIPRLTMIIGLTAVPFTLLINFFNGFLMGQLKVRQQNIVNLLRGILYLLFIIALVLAMRGKVLAAIVSYTSAIVAAAILGLLLFTGKTKPARTIELSFAKPFFNYGIKAYLVIVFTFLNYRLDILLVKHFLTNSDVAFYQIAVNAAERLWYIPNALKNVLLPTLLMMNRGSAEFTAKVCRNSLLIMSILSLVLLFFGKFFVVFLYGQEYYRVAHALYSILWGITITTLFKVLSADFAARRQLGILGFAAGTGVAVNVVANLYLIPRFGIVGAGVATSLSYTILSIILVIFFVRQRKVKVREILFPIRDDFSSYREVFKKLLRRIRGNRDQENGSP